MNNVDRLVEENLNLVHYCCHKLKVRASDYEDMYQTGCLGLVKAAKNFDESRGVVFSTYAVPVIFGEIKRVYRDSSPVKLGREPTIGEIAKEMQLSREEVSEAICAAQSIISLTASGEEGEVQFDIPTESHEEEVCSRLSLSKAISELPEREKKLVVMRYFRHKTQNQTAKVLGMTQVQVSRLEKKIMVVIRGKMTG